MRHLIAKKIGDERQLTSILQRAGGALLLRALGALCAFALNIIIGRQLGTAGAGHYYLALSVCSVLAIVARMGMDNALLRFVSVGVADANWGAVCGAFDKAVRLSGCVGFALAGLVWIGAPQIAIYGFDAPNLAAPLRWISLAIVTFALLMVVSEALKGLGRVRDSMLVSGVIYPLAAICVIFPLVEICGVAGAAQAYVIGTSAALIYGLWAWRRQMSPRRCTPDFSYHRLWQSGRKLWLMAILNTGVLPWAPLFFLGALGNPEESGIFGAATRMAMLVSFFVTAANTVITPKYAALIARGEMENLSYLARRTTAIVMLAASPVFLLLIIKSHWVMGLFGEDFRAGGLALAILICGQVVKLATGSAGYLLLVSGHEADIRNSSILSCGLVLVGSVILIPTYGLTGAAMASALALAGMSLMDMVFVYLRLKVVLLPG